MQAHLHDPALESLMKSLHMNAVAMTLKDVLRPKEVGEQVVSHVLEDVREPMPDFEAMRRVLADNPNPKKTSVSDRALSEND